MLKLLVFCGLAYWFHGPIADGIYEAALAADVKDMTPAAANLLAWVLLGGIAIALLASLARRRSRNRYRDVVVVERTVYRVWE